MNPFDPEGMLPGDPNQPPQQPPPTRVEDAGAGDVAGGVLDAAGDGAGGVLDGLSLADGLGCLDGCSGCGFATILVLILTANAAFAAFRRS